MLHIMCHTLPLKLMRHQYILSILGRLMALYYFDPHGIQMKLVDFGCNADIVSASCMAYLDYQSMKSAAQTSKTCHSYLHIPLKGFRHDELPQDPCFVCRWGTGIKYIQLKIPSLRLCGLWVESRSLSVAAMQYSGTRVANDGQAYTWQEFASLYGRRAVSKWRYAKPGRAAQPAAASSSAPAASSSTPPIGEQSSVAIWA